MSGCTPNYYDNRPVSARHPLFSPALAHSWVRYDNQWMLTTCGLALSSGEYVLLAPGDPITCITCLVKAQ